MKPCTIGDCQRPVHGRGMCTTHLKRDLEGRPVDAPVTPKVKPDGKCAYDDCDRPARTRGWCRSHYQQWKRSGTVGPLAKPGGQPLHRTCTYPECGRPHYAHGLCVGHRGQQQRGQDLRPLGEAKGGRGGTRPTPAERGCLFEGCDKPHRARGYCRAHHDQLRKGRALTPIGSTVGQKGGWATARKRYCDEPGCEAKHYGHGKCRKHYERDRVGTRPKPERKPRTTKPKSVLPAGWHKPAKIILEDERPARFGGLTDLPPLYASVIAESDKAAVRAFLARHDALDLADMLGVTA